MAQAPCGGNWPEIECAAFEGDSTSPSSGRGRADQFPVKEGGKDLAGARNLTASLTYN